MNFAQKLGANIAKIRVRQGQTQGDLAHAMGVSRPRVSEWESGKHVMSVETFVWIAVALNTTTDQLLADTIRK